MNETKGDVISKYAGAYGMGIIALKPNSKEPATMNGLHDWTDDPDSLKAWFDEHPNNNVAVVGGTPSHNLVIIDFDHDENAGYSSLPFLDDWEEAHGKLPDTVVAITGRGGYHYYYRTHEPIPKIENEVLHIDLRGEGSYAMMPPSMHPNGNPVYWEHHPDDYPIAFADDNVMELIKYIQTHGKKKKGKFKLKKEYKKPGRNKAMTSYAGSLQSQKYSDEEIREKVHEANKKRCKPPLPDNEIDCIVDSITSYKKGWSEEAKAAHEQALKRKEEQAAQSRFRKQTKSGKGPILHNVVARELIEEHKVCFVNGAPAIWDGKKYACGWPEIEKAIINLIDECKANEQREICHYISRMAPKVEVSKPWLIAFNNGVLDVDCGLQDYSDEVVVTNIIPHDYDNKAQCQAVDDFLDKISCGDKTTRRNLEEVIGVCMYRANDFGQCPVLIGEGSNGKSTFIQVLRNVLGLENVSSLDVNIIGKQFQAGRLLGKLANLGDDISNERLNGDVLAIFKKIVTGDWIYTDVKGSEGFDFKPYCTLVISCNEFPRLGDASEGMMRRLFPISFDARFSRDDPDYDPRILDKLTTEEAAKRFIKLGIEGLIRVRYYNGFTPNDKSDKIVDDVKKDNDNVDQWVEDANIDETFFIDTDTGVCYENYKKWCATNGLMSYSKAKFSKRIGKEFGLETKPKRYNGNVFRVYVKKSATESAK